MFWAELVPLLLKITPAAMSRSSTKCKSTTMPPRGSVAETERAVVVPVTRPASRRLGG